VKAIGTVVAVAFAVASCGGQSAADSTTTIEAPTTTTTTVPTTTTTVPPTTTTTLSEEQLAEIQFEEDVALIKTLFRRYSDSWFSGTDAGFSYLAEHNYPAAGCTAEEYRDLWQVATGFTEEEVVDENTIDPDPGWAIPGGRAAGVVPEGRIYIFSVTITDAADGVQPSSFPAEVHAVVNDDGAFFFVPCVEL
jgi:hypothetical protein